METNKVIDMVKMKVENESSEEKFKRLATTRTKTVLNSLRILGNCSNRSIYSYTEQDVNLIFNTIEKEMRRVKAQFSKPIEEEFSLG